MSPRTVRDLVAHFAHRQRFFLLPLVFVLLLAGLLLVATDGLAVVAPLVYTLF